MSSASSSSPSPSDNALSSLTQSFSLLRALTRPVEAQYTMNWRQLEKLTEEQKHKLVEQDLRVYGTKENRLYEAKAVCACMGITQKHIANRLKALDDDEFMKLEVGGKVVDVVTEAGLYELAFRSDNEIARSFKHWIKYDVIPSIRSTGQYTAPPDVMKKLELTEKELEELRQNTAKMELDHKKEKKMLIEEHEKEKDEMKKEAERREKITEDHTLGMATFEELEEAILSKDRENRIYSGKPIPCIKNKYKYKNFCTCGCK
jgi:prophage antirepressor-like protein